uniref:Caspase n=1 Tax=Pithovirus LCPAC404 TaxID=2506597 RepID=A0A481ZEP3_9VIRU|nr:MAG: caspase [Pithovirus LCPAC404]
MVRAILIGFCYDDTHDTAPLPGVFFDLFRVYSYCKISGFKDISVITDIRNDYDSELINQIVLDHNFSSDIFEFISNIKNRGEYIQFKSLSDFKTIAKTKISNNLLVYFSGHCLQNTSIQLPDNDVVFIERFRDIMVPRRNLLYKNQMKRKILFILDCCGGELDLPYKLRNKVFRRNDDYGNSALSKLTEIVCIASSSSGERSATLRDGSLFTQACFECLSNEKRKRSHIGDLLSNIHRKTAGNAVAYASRINEKLIRHKQTVSLCSNSLYLPTIWSWVLGRENIDVLFYPNAQTIVVNID